MTQSAAEQQRDESTARSMQSFLNVLAAFLMAIGGYWVQQIDSKNFSQDEAIQQNRELGVRNETHIEYSLKKFDSIDAKMDKLLDAVQASQ